MAKAEPQKPSPPSQASVVPSDIPGVVYRGYGRPDAGSVYNASGSTAVPILGKAKYFAFDKETAGKFGPSIETANPKDILKNPLVIRDGNQSRALTKEAGWVVPNPFGDTSHVLEAKTKAIPGFDKKERI